MKDDSAKFIKLGIMQFVGADKYAYPRNTSDKTSDGQIEDLVAKLAKVRRFVLCHLSLENVRNYLNSPVISTT
jgi:hypothetical protein